MADRTMKRGDTYPPLRGEARDANGVLDLSTAQALEVRLNGPGFEITGIPVPITPPLTDADGIHQWNWEYTWVTGDTENIGSYKVELTVTWGPGQIETFPSEGSSILDIVERET